MVFETAAKVKPQPELTARASILIRVILNVVLKIFLDLTLRRKQFHLKRRVKTKKVRLTSGIFSDNILELRNKDFREREGVLFIDKFLAVINLPRHIKRYFYIRKIEGYMNSKNKNLILAINLLITLLTLATGFYVLFVIENRNLKIAGIMIGATALLAWLVRISFFVINYEKRNRGISKLILKGEDGKNLKVWDTGNKMSFVIGKGSPEAEVDIDLSDVEYASLVSKQHAVLNCSGDSWYIEDIGSTNGSGIKRHNENSRFKLEADKPYPIHSGDIIYIANTKILVK